jgi:hypothetical protein
MHWILNKKRRKRFECYGWKTGTVIQTHILGDLTIYRAMNTTSSSVKKNEPCLTKTALSMTRKSDEFIAHLSESKAYSLCEFLNEDMFRLLFMFRRQTIFQTDGAVQLIRGSMVPHTPRLSRRFAVSRDKIACHALSANSEDHQTVRN